MTNWLIETEDLARLLNTEPDADRVVLDCSWYLPEAGKDAIDDYRAGHIPGARFVDLADISDRDARFINMLPTPEVFAQAIGALGIGNQTRVIVYDAGYVSARLWWMFRVFGHDRVQILNGGWRKWTAEGRDVETGDASLPRPRSFAVSLTPGRVATVDRVRSAIDTGSATLIDARTAAKFQGIEGSGYPGVASGAMPGAINFPWARFFDADNAFTFVSADRAAEIFAEGGVDLNGPIITTCGSGVTASILGFMVEQLGNDSWLLYDGSWHEWGQLDDTPKVVLGAPQ